MTPNADEKPRSGAAERETAEAGFWHALDAAAVMAALRVDAATGLSEGEAEERLFKFGPNRLREQNVESVWETFLDELREPMIVLLLVTGALYGFWGDLADALTIFAVIVALLSAEVVNERRATLSIAALSKLAEPTASLRRGGRRVDIPAERIVPGDVVLLDPGRRISADVRIVESYGLAADESSLTGESASVAKEAVDVMPASTALAERRNMAYAGTAVVRGRGVALVIATGAATALGRAARLAREVERPRTILQTAMGELSGILVWIAIGFSVLVPLLGVVLARQPVRQMLLTGLSLAFSVIPEELPIIITMVLGLGAYRLARQHAIVRRLQAVETLGAVTVIATDKTGTLTENRMELARLYPETMTSKLLESGVLCNDATGIPDQSRGDPLDVAMLHAAANAGIDPEALRRRWRMVDEFTFDNVRKRMSIVYERDGHWILVKGAPEPLLEYCVDTWRDGQRKSLDEADRRFVVATANDMARAGLRVVAFAEKTIANGRTSQAEAEASLTFIGLAGFADPPRPEVRQAIADCRAAGIRPVMVTGDHPLTAMAIARQVGLNEDGRVVTGIELDAMSDTDLRETVAKASVYARTTPEHKLRIVRALRDLGGRVAVTGDGINDAPALAAADVGVAMGETGTDVARDAAGVVLADDNFATIVRAVREGRLLFANLTKGVRYYLACKVALVATALLPVLLSLPVPFAPVQIILMELFMDLAASASFVAEPGEVELMQRRPRDPAAKFMDRAMVGSIFASAGGLFAAVSVAYLVTWHETGDLVRAQTMAFVTWLLSHVLLAFNMRSEREPLWKVGLLSNRVMAWWGVATGLFIVAATVAPSVGIPFKVVPLSIHEWWLVIGVSVLGTSWIELLKLTARRHGTSQLPNPG